MKKIFLSVVCLVIVTLQTMADTRQAILLLHNGNGTMFEFTQLQDAVNAAEDGDTLLLSEGSFNTSLTINKKVSIIGVGQKSIIRGNINVAIPDVVISGTLGSETTEMPVVTATMLDALQIRGNVQITNRLSGFKMRKCWMTGHFDPAANIYNATIDRCFINEVYSRSGLKSIKIQNCSITKIEWDYASDTRNSEINFINCNIGTLEGYSNFKALYLNCIIKAPSAMICRSTFINTLYTNAVKNNISTSNDLGCVSDQCYVVDFNSTSGEDGFLTFSFTKEDLESGGYLGADGTVVGMEGGQTPFSLLPSRIAVTESQLKVDTEKKQLNVTLKVKAN